MIAINISSISLSQMYQLRMDKFSPSSKLVVIEFPQTNMSLDMTGCMGKRVFCDTGGNFEKCTF